MTETAPQRFRRLADHFDRVVSAVPDDRWSAPSPCADWTVADVVDHVAGSEQDFLERQGLSIGAASASSPVARWRAVRDAMQAAIDDPAVADRSFDGYFGPTTIAETIDTFYSMDLAVHAWDVARGAGLHELEAISDDDIEHSRTQLAPVGDTVRMAGIFGAPVEVPEDSSEVDKFLAWTGRRP